MTGDLPAHASIVHATTPTCATPEPGWSSQCRHPHCPGHWRTGLPTEAAAVEAFRAHRCAEPTPGPPPVRADFPHDDNGTRQYGHAFRTWRTMRDDSRPTRAERAAAAEALAEISGLPPQVCAIVGARGARLILGMEPQKRD